MSNTQATIAAIERLLEKKQAIPSKILRDLLTDAKELYALSIYLRKENEQLKAKAVQS